MIIKTKGYITGRIKFKDANLIQTVNFENHTLDSGKKLLASNLLEHNDKRPYINNWLIGDGGTKDNIPKEIIPTMKTLFGVVRLKKPVIAQVDPEIPTRLLCSIDLDYDEANDYVMNEFGLELSDGTLFCLSTFADFKKTNEMAVSWGWEILFI